MESAYEQFINKTGGNDRKVLIYLSTLASLIDNSVLSEREKQLFIDAALRQVNENKSGGEAKAVEGG